MITDEQFDERVHELFNQLAERVSTIGEARSILDRPPGVVAIRTATAATPRRGRWIVGVAAACLVGLAVAAVSTRDGSVHPISPAPTEGVVDSAAVAPTVADTIAATVPQTQPVAVEPSTTSTVPTPQDPYAEVAVMLQAARDISYRATVKSVTECMLSQGYTYQSVPDPWEAFTSVLTSQPWNTPSVERATSRGYLQPHQGEPVVNPDGDTGFGTEAYQHALYGDVVDNWETPPGETVPDGFGVGGPVMDGCRPTAERQIVGNGDPRAASRIADYYGQMQHLEIRIRMDITSTPAYAALVGQWSICMGEHGYEFTDLEQPRRKAWPGQRPAADEIAAATQDASCKSEVGLTQYGDERFAAATADWFAQRPGRFAEITEYMNGITDRATAILAA